MFPYCSFNLFGSSCSQVISIATLELSNCFSKFCFHPNKFYHQASSCLVGPWKCFSHDAAKTPLPPATILLKHLQKLTNRGTASVVLTPSAPHSRKALSQWPHFINMTTEGYQRKRGCWSHKLVRRAQKTPRCLSEALISRHSAAPSHFAQV